MENASVGLQVATFLTAIVTLGLGIYGLSDSILAAIALPVSSICFRVWHVSGEG